MVEKFQNVRRLDRKFYWNVIKHSYSNTFTGPPGPDSQRKKNYHKTRTGYVKVRKKKKLIINILLLTYDGEELLDRNISKRIAGIFARSLIIKIHPCIFAYRRARVKHAAGRFFIFSRFFCFVFSHLFLVRARSPAEKEREYRTAFSQLSPCVCAHDNNRYE